MPHIYFNLYHYAGNNPERYLDPDGRAAFIIYNEHNQTVIDKNTSSLRLYHIDEIEGNPENGSKN